MASIVLTAVGNAVLPGIGGAVLGTLGRAAGGMLDQQLGLTGSRKLIGPRLENLKVQDSRYGAGIPLLFGRTRVAGQVIWASDLEEIAHEDQIGGGKGGGGNVSSVRYSYSINCAIAIGQGPLAQLTGVWADGKQLYDGLVWKSGLAASVSFYPGDASQLPDPVLQAALGSDNVPAYRGIAYLVFEQLQLADFGNRLPNLTFEVIAAMAAAAPSCSAVTEPLLESVNSAYATLGGTPPLQVSGSSGTVSKLLVAGMQNVQSGGSNAAFVAVTYDVNGDQPQEIARVTAPVFTITAPLATMAWALAPDGRTVAWLAATSGSPLMSATLIFYDIPSQQFGAPLSFNLRNFPRSLIWLDALHVAVADHDGNALGLQVFARRGLAGVACGFTGIWGAGSAGTRFPVGTAHFITLPAGILMLAGNAATNPTALYACHCVWDDNQLLTDAPYVLTSLVPAGSQARADIVPCGNGEYLFVFRRTDRLVLCSFVPSASGVVVTRNWQTVMLSVTGTDTGIAWFGSRLVALQRSSFGSQYYLSEILLQPTGFVRVTDAVPVMNPRSAAVNYQPYRLDHNRLLVQGGADYALDFAELTIITRDAGSASLEQITRTVLNAAGYESGDSELSALADAAMTGYSLVPPLTGRGALEPLRQFLPFDLIESGTQLKAVPRHAALDCILPESELRATRDSQQIPPAVALDRAPELELPQVLTVDYLDPAQDFAANSQQARRMVTTTQTRVKLSLPLACSADAARQVAQAQLYAFWTERTRATFTLTRRYLALEPGDVVQIGTATWRIQQLQQLGGLLQCKAVANYVPPAAATGLTDVPLAATEAQLAPPTSQLLLADLPPLSLSADTPGLYAAIGATDGWRGASLWRAADGVNYQRAAQYSQAATAGIAVTVLSNGSPDYPDNNGTVEIQLLQGALASCTALEQLNGVNVALLGDEIIQFQSAALLGRGYYRLGNLLRGRRGTEAAIGTHALGERFLLLEPDKLQWLPLTLSDRGLAYDYKAVTVGQNLAEAVPRSFTANLRSLQPWAPAQLKGMRAGGIGSDLSLSWIRRARLNHSWLDNIDVPLDEPSELYDLEILDSANNLKRTISGLTSPAYVYTAAQQSADFAVIPSSYSVRVYQLGARYGRGVAATAVI